MNKTFDKQTRKEVIGNIDHEGNVLRRTPLHVAFGNHRSFMPADPIESKQLRSKTVFNAIGSRCVGTTFHLPVIDVDGGAERIRHRGRDKVILGAAHDGHYEPKSWLRDVLGDNGIELEVFEYPDFTYSTFSGNRFNKMKVSSLVLRSEAPIFEVVPSTQDEHAHLYINQPFSESDHTDLLNGLAETGIVSQRWRAMAVNQGMGIIRTPWTEKDLSHLDS